MFGLHLQSAKCAESKSMGLTVTPGRTGAETIRGITCTSVHGRAFESSTNSRKKKENREDL